MELGSIAATIGRLACATILLFHTAFVDTDLSYGEHMTRICIGLILLRVAVPSRNNTTGEPHE